MEGENAMKRLKRHRVTFPYPEVPVLYPMCDGEDVAQLEAKYAELEKICAELIQAGEPLVERWDTPKWKWDEHTGTLIARLRAAIGKAKGEQP